MSKLKNFILYGAVMMLTACGGGGDGGDKGSVTAPAPSNPVPAPLDPKILASSVGTGTIRQGAEVLSATDAATSTFVGDKLTVSKPQTKLFKVGEIIILDAHGGALLKVTAVAETASQIIYTVEQAALTEVFDELKIAFKGEIGRADLGNTINSGDPNIDISWTEPALSQVQAGVEVSTNQLTIKYKNLGGQVGSGIDITGSSAFVLNPDFFFRLAKQPGLATSSVEMGATLSPNLTTTLGLESKYGGQIAYSYESPPILLGSIRKVVIVPPGIPIPIYIQPVLTIGASVSGTAGSSFKETTTYTTSGEIGFTRTIAEGNKGKSSMTQTSKLAVSDAQGEIGVNATAPKFELAFLLYKAVGPYADIANVMGTKGSIGMGPSPTGGAQVEGVNVEASVKLEGNVGIKFATDLTAAKKLLKDVSIEFSPVSIKVLDANLGSPDWKWFFPFKGTGAITVRDNGSVPDDIFSVSIDGVSLGRTSKGGSGQFRVKDLRPGERTLTITTVEDDSPPGTYEVSLGDGLKFSDGTTLKSGSLNLGASTSFKVMVPTPPQ